jgi:TrmH family RNA methyltransferase
VQRLRRLLHQKHARHGDRAFVAEGTKVVSAALDAGAPIEALYFDAGADLSPTAVAVVERARATGVRVFPLAAGVMERVADAVTPQPLCAVIGFSDVALSGLAPGVVVVLVDVRDPGNVGGIIRSADAAGAAGIVVCEGSGDPYNPKTVRASAGSLFHLPLVLAADPEELRRELSARAVATVGAVAHGGVDYAAGGLDEPLALFFGNEAAGLPADLTARLDHLVTVPIAGGAESLNVAMAATVICFELARRRRSGSAAPLSMTP